MIAAVAPDLCTCGECADLDRAHPREGRQLALVRTSSGELPGALPLTDPDAPTAVTAGVSAPEGRTVETHALAAEAGDTSPMNAITPIAKPRGRLKPVAEIPSPSPSPATPSQLVPSSPQLIELRRLRRAEENVRHTRIEEDFQQLADDIAAHGLLQSLIGYTTAGSIIDQGVDTLMWEQFGLVHIVGGGRRFAALRELENRGLIEGDFPIPVLIRSKEDAIELSLSENLQQRKMSPVDEFFAFQALMDRGIYSPATLAARFGFSERIVKQRLRLAQLDSEVLDALAERKITIDTAMAYAGSQDRDLQRTVFRAQVKKASSYSNAQRPDDVKWALRSKGATTDHQLFKFIGAEAYERRGGGYEDDLFLDSAEAGKMLRDPHLLQEVARELIDFQMAGKLEELKQSKEWAPTIVGYVLTNDLKLDNYGNGATPPKGFERVEKYESASIWKTVRNNGIEAHVMAGITYKGELTITPKVLFVPKDQKQAVAPEQASQGYRQPTAEEQAAEKREREVARLARRLAVGPFTGTPFEGRAFWPDQWNDRPIADVRGGVPGQLVPVMIFVSDAAIAAQQAEAEAAYEWEFAAAAAADAASEKLGAELAAMEPPAVVILDGEAWARTDEGAYMPVDDGEDGFVGSWSALLANFDPADVGVTFATRDAFDAEIAAIQADQAEGAQA